ncbi:MAG: PEPxxWA-CTERM sorting domain-containing protein [Alphaproteobacteria bacterium]|nr:PEPxxWA-CTERM sorting domain-containing protein [Alphaproteobacteria bacterium]MBU1513585.1 PEPxxWA-CTERM sorting domain-containing protein [Alphaproteobacteria bacterium]MBU2094770.1 PEPxxWA-CTERM sorting domain-containing protein [Alphaproteobacteria bacterium]MBU2150161.1 PEPxxWA-CTERM sorting domain-containing protein [Alphaproteobacteria bacterium]MBU2309310.1 PEPxxWA-CTERM sorting domain-containing protein [Alphaproteobacteria bacterium]
MAALFSTVAAPALAAVTFVPVNIDVSIAPFTYDFGGGSALTFDNNTSGFASELGVQTTGSAQVFSVFGTPSLFQPFAETLFPSQQLGAFASFATSTPVNFSLSSGSIGFKFTLADGDHFGIAQTDGSLIGALYIQGTPGADIDLGSPSGGAVPEPSTWALLIVGFGLTGGVLRRGRRESLALA